MGLSGLLWRRLCRPLIMAQPEVRTFASGKIKPPKEIPRHVKKKAKRGADYSNRNFGPHSVFIQAIGAGSRDAGASLYVFSDENRYLFNCAEGTQRLMTENKLKLCQLDNVFVTRMNWANVGGMSGLLLTLKDMGVPSCLLSGPPQLEKFIQGVKSYCGPLNPLNIDVRPYTDPDPYVDETMAVHQVPIFSAQSEKDDWGQPCVISYVCKVHDKKGNFQVVKAKELGLPVGTRQIGPLIADLKNGKSITFEGKEIFPGDLLTPTVPGPRFIVVECPSEDFLIPIIENETLKRHQEGNPNAEVALIIHLTPEHILNHSSYRQWMEQFGQETEHLILNESVSSVHNQSAYKIQTQLNLIHPRIFPLLPEPSGQGREETGKRGIKAECLLKYQLRPTMEVQRDMIPNNDLLEYVKEAMELPGFKEAVKDCSILLESDQSADDADPHYPEVVFLGTGSAVPMKTRNVSSTLLRISSTQVLMLDCGEGTFGQLYRHYGEETDDILCHLSVVFVSHIHADHHTGLLRILYERERALKSKGMPFSPVILVGPTVLMTWLNIFHKNCQKLLHNISFIPSQNLVQGKDISCPKTQSLFSSLLEKNELEKFETCYVAHCKNAFGCSVVHQSGWKLVFSGDTMPCEALIKMGKDAKLLIHEATLEDGLEQDALEKAHSTMSQAINVARKMNAEFVILNHFSQRYSRIPLITDEFSKKVGIAFDHMRIRWSDFHILPKLVEPIKTLFAANIVEMEEKRERKRERNQQEVSNSADQSTESTSNKQDLGENEDLRYKKMKFW